MYGVEDSKHWAEDTIYKLLRDEQYHTFDEIFREIKQKEEKEMTRGNLSTVLHRLQKKYGNIIHYKTGLFKLKKCIL